MKPSMAFVIQDGIPPMEKPPVMMSCSMLAASRKAPKIPPAACSRCSTDRNRQFPWSRLVGRLGMLHSVLLGG